jgi:hypothetical protein
MLRASVLLTMRLAALLLGGILTTAPALAQEVAPGLPVSLDNIRKALALAPAEPLKGVGPLKEPDARPLFRSLVRERLRIEELLQTLKFNSGPAVPGGLYGYEQQQILFPKVDNPLAQPYGAFSQGELVQISLTTIIAKYLTGQIVHAVTSAERARAEEAAREEVRRALEDYWAAQDRAAAPP